MSFVGGFLGLNFTTPVVVPIVPPVPVVSVSSASFPPENNQVALALARLCQQFREKNP